MKKQFLSFVFASFSLSALAGCATNISSQGTSSMAESSSSSISSTTSSTKNDPVQSKYGLSINMPEGRDLRVAQFADLHFGIEGKDWHNDKVERTKEYMDYIVETTSPDLIVCSGDNILSTGVNALIEFIEKMDSYQIPWTYIYGNHDSESNAAGYSKAELSNTLANYESEYLLYEEGYIEEGTENRYGNFSISVLNTAGNKLLGSIILMDAGVYDYSKSQYQTITEGQIDWYKSEIDRLQAIYNEQLDNSHDVIPSIVFSHIQLPEFATAYTKALENDGASFVIKQELSDSQIASIASDGPTTNTSFYDVLVEKKSTKAYFVGHAHIFKFQVKMDDIVLGFGPQAGFSKSFDDNDLARDTYIYNVARDFSFTTSSCKEDTTGLGLLYSGTYEGKANYDETANAYVVKASFVIWNRIAFSYDGVRLTTDDMTVTGLFVNSSEAPWNENLYTTDGKRFIYSGSTTRNYIFTYNPTTKTLDISEEKSDVVEDYTKVVADKVNVDAGGDAVAVWTTAGTYLKEAATWVGNGWRYYIVVDSEGRIAYAVVNPPNGYGGPSGDGYYANSYYSDYTTNPAIEILDGYGPWVQGGTAHNQYSIKVPEGGFAITAHGTGNTKLVNLLSNGTISNMSDSNLNARGVYDDNLRVHYDSATKTITTSLV